VENYDYKVGGVYADKLSAENSYLRLREAGFNTDQVYLLAPDDALTSAKLEPEGNEIPKEVVKDTLIGAGAGGVAGAVGSAALGVAGATLFVANPVIATLMITGYAATIGGIVGAAKALNVEKSAFDSAMQDILREKHWAVVVHCYDNDEEDRARQVLRKTFAEQLVTQ
jgi:hypothetical protein